MKTKERREQDSQEVEELRRQSREMLRKGREVYRRLKAMKCVKPGSAEREREEEKTDEEGDLVDSMSAKPITNDDDNQKALDEVEKLMVENPPCGTKNHERMMALAGLIKKYEDGRYRGEFGKADHGARNHERGMQCGRIRK